jgi:hypothetical protein
MADVKWKELEDQLKKIGCNFAFWGRSELHELANVLLPGETVEHCVNGSYEGGFAMLVATDQRVLLIDKKPLYLTLEDVRFDMVAEVDFNHRLLNSNIFICTPNKSLRFIGYNHMRLRKLFHYVQTRVAEIREHYTVLQQTLPQAPTASLPASQVAPSAVVDATVSQPEQPTEQLSAPAAPAIPATSDAAEAPRPLSGPRLYVPKLTQAAAYRPTAPVLGAYTRLPLMSRQRHRFLGARAMNTPLPSIYQQ